VNAASDALAAAYRADAGRIRATLVRLLGGFEAADDALAEACAIALSEWPALGVPANPAAWLTTTAKRKAIDRLRREQRLTSFDDIADALDAALPEHSDAAMVDRGTLERGHHAVDDRLRLLFCACHPALTQEAQIALTLHALGGLSTEDVARAFLVSPTTMAQRLVRAKRKIALARIPYEVPQDHELKERLETVAHCLYLIFNAGYTAGQGDDLQRRALTAEAIRLARLLVALLPDPEAQGLLALLLLTEARASARVDDVGDLVVLEEQDRSLWNAALIEEGKAHLLAALAQHRVGPYQLQAAIAAVHDEAAHAADTDWRQIAGLYAELRRFWSTPVVRLNQAVAIAMAGGVDDGLAEIEVLARDPALEGYHLVHAAQADLLRRAGRHSAAAKAYRRARARCENVVERRYLDRRLRELQPPRDT
jgi:RNA polymerase sigma-70 factor (ECF subfamily)